MNNMIFISAYKTLSNVSFAHAIFSKAQFDDFARAQGCYSNNLLDTLRDMGVVVLHHKEDCSVIFSNDRWSYNSKVEDITIDQYNALPQVVKDSLPWEVQPRVRHWYNVNWLALNGERTRRLGTLEKEKLALLALDTNGVCPNCPL